MRGAGLVVAPSGAALANMVFLPPGARVVELRPPQMAGAWTTLAAAALGLDHVVLPARTALAPGEVPPLHRLMQMPRRLTRRYAYHYAVDVEAVLEAATPPP
jgi:capsular polysaccharide biosynthesis protein